MSRPERQRYQVVVKRLAGAEAWLLVLHDEGAFRLPMTASVGELYEGVVNKWRNDGPARRRGTGTVRVPLDQWLDGTGWRRPAPVPTGEAASNAPAIPRRGQGRRARA